MDVLKKTEADLTKGKEKLEQMMKDLEQEKVGAFSSFFFFCFFFWTLLLNSLVFLLSLIFIFILLFVINKVPVIKIASKMIIL